MFVVFCVVFSLFGAVVGQGLPERNVNLFIMTVVDVSGHPEALNFMIVDFIFAPNFFVTSNEMAILYVNRQRVDELALNETIRKGHLEGPLNYVIGNVFVRVDIVEIGTENIRESTRVMFTG